MKDDLTSYDDQQEELTLIDIICIIAVFLVVVIPWAVWDIVKRKRR
jgi:hypothetical protein